MRKFLSLVCTLATVIALSVLCQPVARGRQSASQTTLVTFFGPEVFTRDTGKPITETRLISTSGHEEPFVLHLRNGDATGKFRVSSATVSLNDRVLFDQSQFSKQQPGYDLTLQIPNPSALKVCLASKPGSQLTIWIEGRRVIAPILDTSHSVEKVIDGKGGRITATSAAGLQMQLVVPELAIINPTAIRMTPIISISDMPWKGSFVCGMQLEPDNLQFARPAELIFILPDSFEYDKYVIGFAYRSQGTRSHFYPVLKNNATLTMSAFHFSGYGAVMIASDEDLAASEALTPSDRTDRFEQDLASVLTRVQISGDIPTSEELADLYNEYYNTVFVPALNAFYACVRADCPLWGELANNVLLALETMVGWQLPGELGDQVLALVEPTLGGMATALMPMYQRWNDECAQTEDCSLRREEIDSILALGECMARLGNGPDIATICGGLNKNVFFATIIPGNSRMFVGDTLLLNLGTTAGGGTPADATVAWESTNPAVAQVDSNTGLVTANGEGSTTIVAVVCQCGKCYVDTATVVVVKSLTFSGTVTINLGDPFVIGEPKYPYELTVSGIINGSTGSATFSGFKVFPCYDISPYPWFPIWRCAPFGALPNMPGYTYGFGTNFTIPLTRNGIDVSGSGVDEYEYIFLTLVGMLGTSFEGFVNDSVYTIPVSWPIK